MHRNISASLTMLIALSALDTFAASSIDLAVSGRITPSACTPTLGTGGVVDFGKIAAKDLVADSSTWLPGTIVQLRVSCRAPTLFALRGNDNRAGTAHTDDGYGFGMGLINGGQKIGTYLLTVRNPASDTASLIPLIRTNNSEFWLGFPHGVFLTWHSLAAFGASGAGVPVPIALAEVTADLLIQASIAPASGLTLDREVPLDGSATLEVIYL